MIHHTRIEVVDHKDQRYNTVGDWFYDWNDKLCIRASRIGDPAMEACLAVHELVEALVCQSLGVKQDEVDKFDLAYKGEGEPGDDPYAPYYRAHQVASAVERMLAFALNVSWSDYEVRIAALHAERAEGGAK